MSAGENTAAVSESRAKLWTGRIASGIIVLFMLFDGVIKLVKPAPVVESFAQLGYPSGTAAGIGMAALGCTILYAIRRTSVLGAILLTGYLGGAIATHVRAGNPLFSDILFPVYMGVLVWGGIYLRNERLRALIPIERRANVTRTGRRKRKIGRGCFFLNTLALRSRLEIGKALFFRLSGSKSACSR